MHQADAQEAALPFHSEALAQVQRVVISVPGENATVAEKFRDLRWIVIPNSNGDREISRRPWHFHLGRKLLRAELERAPRSGTAGRLPAHRPGALQHRGRSGPAAGRAARVCARIATTPLAKSESDER